MIRNERFFGATLHTCFAISCNRFSNNNRPVVYAIGQRSCLPVVAEGLGNREIAQTLEPSEHTVKNYIFHIFDKLGISNRVELVLYAVSTPNAAKIIAPETPIHSTEQKAS